MRRIFHGVWLAATLQVSACVLIPVPHSEDIGQAVSINPTDIGVLTRGEAIARWGEPTMVLDRERTVAYAWRHEGWMICGTEGGHTGCFPEKRDHFMLIQFDVSGRVQRAEEPSYPPSGRESRILTMKEFAYRDATEIGVTTREEIVARFGGPHIAWLDRHVCEYRYLPKDNVLLIEFDDHDRVSRAAVVSPRRSSGRPRDYVGDWMKEKAGVNP